MLGYLAVVAFCLNGECAFYVSKTIVDSEVKCEAQLPRMMSDIDNQFKTKVPGIAGCIKVPVQMI